MDKEFALPYGSTCLRARIPAGNLAFVLAAREVAGLADERAAVLASLRNPIGAAPLRELVRPGDKVVVIATDNTRPCPDDRLLPPILAELETVVPRRNISIIIATGLHPALDRAQLVRKLGEDVVGSYHVVNHDVSDTVCLGTTKRGTPVDISRLVVEADFRLSTGFIEPHFFAGFSGGRKSIAPGVFGVRSAYHNHGYDMIAHPRSRAGVLEGNPVHEDLVEQAAMARLDFIVNVLLNSRRQVTHVFAGNFIKAHEQGCSAEREIVAVEVPYPVDIAVTTNSGAPLDLDLYQTCKGIDTAAQITRDGGIIIAVSSCSAGVGPGGFRALHACASSPGDVLSRIRCEAPGETQWQNQILARTQMRNTIYLVSELEESVVREMMMVPVRSVEEGLERAFEALGEGARVGVIPEGPLVLPVAGRPGPTSTAA